MSLLLLFQGAEQAAPPSSVTAYPGDLVSVQRREIRASEPRREVRASVQRREIRASTEKE